jgi:hypothetical protein
MWNPLSLSPVDPSCVFVESVQAHWLATACFSVFNERSYFAIQEV